MGQWKMMTSRDYDELRVAWVMKYLFDKVAHAERNTCDSKDNLWAYTAGSSMVICGKIRHYFLGTHTP